MKVTGVSGQLKVGGRVAASLGRWSYDGTPAGWKVEADTSDVDEFWFDNERPMDLWLDVGQQAWKWRGVTVKGQSRVTISGQGSHET